MAAFSWGVCGIAYIFYGTYSAQSPTIYLLGDKPLPSSKTIAPCPFLYNYPLYSCRNPADY